MGTSNEANETLDVSKVNGSGQSYEELIKHVTPIAKPLASKKLTKRIYKCVKKSFKQKKCLESGLKGVQRALKKGEKGIVILAGDVRPIETICHLPVFCEDKNIPYCYVPANKELGAVISRRGMTCAFIRQNTAYQEVYQQCVDGINQLPSVH